MFMQGALLVPWWLPDPSLCNLLLNHVVTHVT